MISSQLTTTVAAQQQADLLAAAERSRRTAGHTPRAVRTERPRRIARLLRRRPAVA
jgi:hypothetical protein